MAADESTLGQDDFRDVCRELVPVKARWYHVGVELGLRPGDLDAIQNQHDHDIDRALNAMVSVWLRKDYNVTKFGPPSWSRLVEAVGNAAGGRNPAQAEQIAANHPEMRSESPSASAPSNTTFPKANDGELGNKDTFEVAEYLHQIGNTEICRLGAALGLDWSSLKKMKDLPEDMVHAWLLRKDDVIKKSGNPTWSSLVVALRKVGHNGIAQTIEEQRL